MSAPRNPLSPAEDLPADSSAELEALDPAQRTRCEIYTRVMGYHRPVGFWNRGKQQEHRDRVQFREDRVPAEGAP